MRQTFRRVSDYNFNYGVQTQAEVAPERVHRLLGLFGQDGVNRWFAARFDRNELSGYLSDLEIARGLAEGLSTAPTHSIGLLTRYSLFLATIRSMANNLSPILVARLVESRVFTQEQATALARASTEPAFSFEMMIEALKKTGPSVLAEQWLEAVDVGARIPDSDNKVLSLVRFVSDIPPHLRPRLLHVIEQERNEGSRSGALKRLAEVSDLDDDTRNEIWRMACQITHERIRADAMIAVGARMKEPDQSKAVEVYVAAVSTKVAGYCGRDEIKRNTYARSELNDASGHLFGYPMRLLEQLEAETKDAIQSEVLSAAVLGKASESHPLRVYEAMTSTQHVVPDLALRRVCSLLLRDGRHDEAVDCIQEMSPDRSNDFYGALGEALAIVQPPSNARLLSIFGYVPKQHQPYVLKLVAAHPESREGLLRSLVASARDESELPERMAKIARVLSDEEVDELIDKHASSEVFADLEHRLSADQARRALAIASMSFRYEQIRPMLLRRLIELGCLDDVVRAIRALNPSYVKTTVDQIAPSWPQSKLRDLFSEIRPSGEPLKVAMFRASLLGELPDRSVGPLVALVCGESDMADRARNLAKLAQFEMSNEDRTLLLKALSAAIKPCLGRREIRRTKGFDWVIDEIAGIGGRKMLSEFLAWFISELDECRVEFETRFEWLLRIASGLGDEEVRGIAWRAVYELCIASDDEEYYEGAAVRIRICDVPPVERVSDGIPDGRPLMLFCATAGRAVGTATADELVRRLENIDDHLPRLYAFLAILPRSSAEVRRRVTERERARLRTGVPGEANVLWELLLESVLPGDLDFDSLRRTTRAFDHGGRLRIVLCASQLGLLRDWMVTETVTSLPRLNDQEKYVVLRALAPALKIEQIHDVVRGISWRGASAVETLVALARSALDKGDASGALDCVSAMDGLHARSVLRPLISALPASGLLWCTQWTGIPLTDFRSKVVDLDPSDLAALAHRACGLGEVELARQFIEMKGRNSSGGEYSVGEILAAAPDEHLEWVLEFASTLEPGDRADAISAILHRRPQRTTEQLLGQIVDDLLNAWSFDVKTMKLRLEDPFKRAGSELLLSLYARALRHGRKGRQEDILDLMQVFARPLISIFGRAAAEALDDACAMGCRSRWP